jgi:MtrB/PioB family decaheme-associated outer membrane protein
MKTMARKFGLGRTIFGAAVLAAFGAAHAQTSEAEGSVGVGVGGVTGDRADRALFGQYNGLRDEDAYGLLNVDYRRRNAANGTSVEFLGTNLGLGTRELIFLWKRQGDWRFSANYDELVRRDPYAVDTGLTGAGTTAPQVAHLSGGPGSGAMFDLETKRKGLGLGFSKWIGPTLEFDVNLRSENKDGSRLFGIGMNCPSLIAPGCGPTTATNAGSAVLMLPEPINANHSQVEARLNYAGTRLRLSGGYYGSFFSNSNGALNPGVPGSLNNPLGTLLPLSAGLQAILSNPVALPPDNQAHQFDVAGNVVITPTTRANFKLAYGTAKQDQDFASAGLVGAPAGVSNLDGKVNTALAQFGISARPIARLSLLADWNYTDKSDKTPLALYNFDGANAYTNRAYSNTKVRSKLQASYQFSANYQGTIGADYEFIDRGSFTASSAVTGVSALRQETEEVGFRAELRRRMTETFSGAISLVTSDRDGSNWLQPNSGVGVTEITNPSAAFASTAIFMPTLADRKRDKVKLFASWQATDSLSLQFSAENGKDKFTAPSPYAVRDTRMNLYSVDANYVLSDAWSFNGYVSRGEQKLNQARPAGYILAFDNTSTNAGFGVVGKPSEKIELGGGVSLIDDKSVYAQSLDATASANTAALLAATGGLPDILFRRSELRLFGKYALNKRSALRLDAIYQRTKFNDWAYGFNDVSFTYSDNTTLTLDQLQSVTFLGVTYVYSWR